MLWREGLSDWLCGLGYFWFLSDADAASFTVSINGHNNLIFIFIFLLFHYYKNNKREIDKLKKGI